MLSHGASIAAALMTLLAAEPEPAGMYLPASETGGSEYQFNPASPELRQAIKNHRVPEAKDLFDARALADDLTFLRRALRKQYAGYPDLLQRPGFDVEALFDQHIARLRAGPPKVTFGESILALFQELKRRVEDRHLNVDGFSPDPAREYAEYQTPLAGPPPALQGCGASGAVPSTLRIAPLLKADGKRAQLLTVSALPQGETLALACADGRAVTLTRRHPAPREDGLRAKPAYEWRRLGDAVVIRIRRFDGPPADRLQLAQLAADYPQHRRAPVIVFDLRGNPGGDDGYASRWVAQAKRGVWDEGSAGVSPPGGDVSWLRWNHEVCAAIRQDRVDEPASVAAREELRRKWPRSPAETTVTFTLDRHDGDAKTPYKGRVFVLVDRESASSGESSAVYLRQALGATLVGERTAGALEYRNVRPLILPRTHLAVFFSTARNYFVTPVEAIGLPIDVYLPPELVAKPAEELLPLLKKLPGASEAVRGASSASR